MTASPTGVYLAIKFSVSFLKDKATDSFLKKKKKISLIFHSYTNIHTQTFICTHTQTHIKIFNLETEFGRDDGFLAVISTLTPPETGAPPW